MYSLRPSSHLQSTTYCVIIIQKTRAVYYYLWHHVTAQSTGNRGAIKDHKLRGITLIQQSCNELSAIGNTLLTYYIMFII